MRYVCVVLCVMALAIAGCVSVKADGNCVKSTTCPKASSCAASATCAKAGCAGCAGPCLRHVVLFKFKDGTAPDKVKEIEEAFAALPDKIPQICAFEWGTDMSVENLAQGFTHAFLLSFKSEDDRAIYLPHPAHKEFGALIGPHLDKVLVIDYWAQR